MKPTTTGEITPAELRKLADLHLGEGLPSLHGACYALSQAADVLEASQAYARKLGEQLNATTADAEQAEARVAVLREALREIAESILWGEDTAIKRTISGIQRDAAEAISTLDPAAERLLAERKILMEAITGIAEWAPSYYDNRDNSAAEALQEIAQNALTALREFDKKETK